MSYLLAPGIGTGFIVLYVGVCWPNVWYGLLTQRTIDAYNAYGSFDASLYPFELLAEPHRATTFRVTPACSCTWRINNVVVETVGESVTHTFTRLGWHNVEATTEDGETITRRIMCKYVRRELRSLTSDDRERFLNAARVLYDVPLARGIEMYGASYRDVHYFVRAHMYWSANYDCDHWHEGPGFVTSHVALSLAFERALQTVDPTVSLPYWDYTMDSDDFRDPELGVFADDVFGAADPDDHVVAEGRWAHVDVLRDVVQSNYSMLANANDELRPPWVNPPLGGGRRGFRRSNTDASSDDLVLSPPSCKHHWWALGQSSWENLAANLNGASHGSMHKLIGGAWNVRLDWNRSVDALYRYADEAWAQNIAAYNFFFLKLVYRAGLFACDDAGRPCRCDDVVRKVSPEHALRSIGILDAIVEYQEATSLQAYVVYNGAAKNFTYPLWNETAKRAVLSALLERACDPGEPGDMNAAGSPFDITFWPIHPTIDRIWHATRLATRRGRAFDETWPANGGICYGHNASHLQPFGGDLFGEEYNASFYTNQQLYDALDPAHDQLPYVYDHFEWPHCDADRYCMNATAVDYDNDPRWSSLHCRSWQPDFDGVGRGYVTEKDVDAPQRQPPALWDADGAFLTDPRPRPPTRRLQH